MGARATTRIGRAEYAARFHRDPTERPGPGWRILPFGTEKWERRDDTTGRVDMVAKRLNPGWWCEVWQHGLHLAVHCTETRGQAMRAAEAVELLDPNGAHYQDAMRELESCPEDEPDEASTSFEVQHG